MTHWRIRAATVLALAIAAGPGSAARADDGGENGHQGAPLAAGDTVLADRPDEPRIVIAPAAAATLYVVDLWRRA